MSFNTYATAVAGSVLAAAFWNQQVRDNGNVLKTSINDAGDTWSGVVTKQLQQRFQGLYLRTSIFKGSGEADVKVVLQALDQVVMNDGTRYSGLTLPLTADITAANGAGALDTGARVTAWYEIWLIGKSSTRAASDLALMFHKAKSYALDQSFTTAPDATRQLRHATSTETDKLAQGVTFTAAKPVEFIDLKLTRAGSVTTGSVWVTIEADSAGNPSGTPLATSDKLDASGIYTTAQIIRFVFRTPFTATAALYHIVLQGDYTRSDTVNIAWSGVAAGGYAGGAAQEFRGASGGNIWQAAIGVGDFWFRQYATTASAALTMPSGYDQSCKLGYVYNNASAFQPFVAREQYTIPLSSLATGSTASVFGELTDLTTFVPPCLLDLDVGLANDTAGLYNRAAGVPDGFFINSSTGGGRVGGGSFVISGKADLTDPQGTVKVLTELQALYFHVQGNNGQCFIDGYRWMN